MKRPDLMLALKKYGFTNEQLPRDIKHLERLLARQKRLAKIRVSPIKPAPKGREELVARQKKARP